MNVHVSVDPELCIGSGDCVRIVPAAFRLDDGAGVSRPTPDAGTHDLDRLLDAARSCPTQAIAIVRDGAAVHGSSPVGRTTERRTDG
ncbi:MAG TPA: ferredoxin [Patescibacteria group bacterium]|nr:ferredoxin [Patescibacteria group bacterium]